MGKRDAPATFGVPVLKTDLVKDGPKDCFLRPDLAAGAAEWSRDQNGKIAALIYVCPCGCGEVRSVPIRPHGNPRGWQWNGDLAAPSLTPSIQQRAGTGCEWHGFLRAGVFEEC